MERDFLGLGSKNGTATKKEDAADKAKDTGTTPLLYFLSFLFLLSSPPRYFLLSLVHNFLFLPTPGVELTTKWKV